MVPVDPSEGMSEDLWYAPNKVEYLKTPSPIFVYVGDES